ncbi:MAG: hypothetical protein ACK5YD_03645 [Phenylobacterium sp.]
MPFLEIVFPALVFIFSAIILPWAILKGGEAERISALIFLASVFASWPAYYFHSLPYTAIILLSIDGLAALGFLFVALTYQHLWIALIMFCIAAYFSLHAYYLAAARPLDQDFANFTNLATLLILLALAQGVWSSRRRSAGRT